MKNNKQTNNLLKEIRDYLDDICKSNKKIEKNTDTNIVKKIHPLVAIFGVLFVVFTFFVQRPSCGKKELITEKKESGIFNNLDSIAPYFIASIENPSNEENTILHINNIGGKIISLNITEIITDARISTKDIYHSLFLNQEDYKGLILYHDKEEKFSGRYRFDFTSIDGIEYSQLLNIERSSKNIKRAIFNDIVKR